MKLEVDSLYLFKSTSEFYAIVLVKEIDDGVVLNGFDNAWLCPKHWQPIAQIPLLVPPE